MLKRFLLTFIFLSLLTAPAGGATFGNTDTTYGDYNATYADRADVCKFTLSEAGSVTKLTFTGRAATAMNAKGLIYNDNAGSPGTQNAVSNPTAVSSTHGSWDLTFASPVALTAGDYWLGIVTDEANSGRFGLTVIAGNVWRNNGLGYTSPASPFGGAQLFIDFQLQIYATYTPGGGAATIFPIWLYENDGD